MLNILQEMLQSFHVCLTIFWALGIISLAGKRLSVSETGPFLHKLLSKKI